MTERRSERLRDLERGLPVVEQVLGLALPSPTAGIDAEPSPDPEHEPDAWFGRLQAAMSGRSIRAEMGWVPLLPEIAAHVPTETLQAARDRAVVLRALDEPALVAAFGAGIDIGEVDLIGSLAQGSFVSTKLNHGFWECVTAVAYRDAGAPYYRELEPWRQHLASRFDEVVLLAIDRAQRVGFGGPPGSGSLRGPRLAFGISPRNGDDPAWQTLEPPLHPNAHGAAVGILASLGAITPDARWRVADGGAAKQLAWQDRLGELAVTLASHTDALMVIGPRHIAGLTLPGWDGPREVIAVPESYIHELWPSVLPVLLGAIARTAEQHRRVTVIVQAGALAALLGLAVALWEPSASDAEVRFLDLGQLVDVIARDDPRAGTWVRKDRVAQRLAAGVAPGFATIEATPGD